MSLENYDWLKRKISTLQNCIEEKEKEIVKLHQRIMEENLYDFKFNSFSLEQLTDFEDNSSFALGYRKELLKLGISEEEMIEFIKKEFEKWEINYE